MPKPRRRYSAKDEPEPCTVTIPPALASYLYREKRRGNFRDETELVVAIVREWADKLEAVDWPGLLAELKGLAVEQQSKQQAETPKRKKSK